MVTSRQAPDSALSCCCWLCQAVCHSCRRRICFQSGRRKLSRCRLILLMNRSVRLRGDKPACCHRRDGSSAISSTVLSAAVACCPTPILRFWLFGRGPSDFLSASARYTAHVSHSVASCIFATRPPNCNRSLSHIPIRRFDFRLCTICHSPSWLTVFLTTLPDG